MNIRILSMMITICAASFLFDFASAKLEKSEKDIL